MLHAEYGHYVGNEINRFIKAHQLQFKVQLISSHGHTVFHNPSKKMTAQLGDGAAIAAETGIITITELRAMDIALGGQGAPIVPIGEKLLLGDYPFFLNLGGIANVSAHLPVSNAGAQVGNNADEFVAYDICPANRILNMIASEAGQVFDRNGEIAAGGKINEKLLRRLNEFEYYSQPYPKSLDNAFGISEIYPVIRQSEDRIENKMRTYVEHVCTQVSNAVAGLVKKMPPSSGKKRILVCGGGAHNLFLVSRLKEMLDAIDVDLTLPDDTLIDFKEALIMALIGVLRWREEKNVLASVTGARRDSIGGAVWIGQEA
jgi:anhydro-N-acetylmuramic acid kinase